MPIHHYQTTGIDLGESRKSSPPNTFPLLYIAVLLALLYSVFLVVRSVWTGAEATKALQERRAILEELKLKVEVSKRYVEYQKTPSYMEKQARQHFGYARPGETVVIVPENTEGSLALADEQAGRSARAQEHVVSTSAQRWWEYFFGK